MRILKSLGFNDFDTGLIVELKVSSFPKKSPAL
jgi:hypothetical protein